MTTNTPRTDAARFEALRGLALRQDCISLKLGQELELELLAARDENFNLTNALSKAEAEVERLKKMVMEAARKGRVRGRADEGHAQ